VDDRDEVAGEDDAIFDAVGVIDARCMFVEGTGVARGSPVDCCGKKVWAGNEVTNCVLWDGSCWKTIGEIIDSVTRSRQMAITSSQSK